MSLVRYPVILALLLFQASLPVQSDQIIRGRVVGVYDGDTVTLMTGSNQPIKIRLAQIDAPESDQAFGQASRQSLASMVFNKIVDCAAQTTDPNGRIVGTLFSDGVDVNREQLIRGMAWVYRQYLKDRSLLLLEKQARRARVGLWSESSPMPPWVYRHGGRAYPQPSPYLSSGQDRNQSTDYSCGSKKLCTEMSSCEEAKYYLNRCGLTRLDKDGDGVPCESICGIK